MVTKEDLIPAIKTLKKTLLENKIPIRRAILFGSYASGKAHAFSDIDVALVSDAFSGVRFFDIEKLIPHLRTFNPLFELHPYRTEDFVEDNNSFVREIINTGIEV